MDKEPPGYALSIVVPGDEDKDVKSRGEKKFNILYSGSVTMLRTFHLPSLGKMLLTEIEAQTFHGRKDAVYLNMGLVRRNGATALLPAQMIDSFFQLERRIARSPLRLPVERFVAVDPKTGKVIPIKRRLKVPRDALDRLSQILPTKGSPERTPVEEAADVDLVLAYSLEEPGETSRATMLHRVAGGLVWNIQMLAGTALEGLARMLQDATCYELSWGPPQEVVAQVHELLGADTQSTTTS